MVVEAYPEPDESPMVAEVAPEPENKPLVGATPSNVFRYDFDSRAPLSAIFTPRTVAVIGATDRAGSMGRNVLWNLISNPFGGTVYPVNPQRPNVLGIKAYPSIKDVPEPVDLAIIATPAPGVPDIISECGAAGVRAAIIVSAGFKERGAEGAELERQIAERARAGRLRVLGPSSLGVMSPHTGLNATVASKMARPGNVAFVSQSGALLSAILDWSFRENVGFSAFVSCGGMMDIGWGDLIDHLGQDSRTKSIVIYMETMADARSFLSAAREVALAKPIILINTGRSPQAAQAAASHTGALTGSYEVFEAAFKRSGVLSVSSIAELFSLAEILAKQPSPKGPRLTILTNAGGPGVLATESLIENGGQLATLSPDTLDKLNAVLPSHWSKSNPLDILGDASANRYAQAFEIIAHEPNSDGTLVVLTPQSSTDATATAERIKDLAATTKKPLIASWMGGDEVAAGESILNEAGIPTFSYPDNAAKIFTLMWRFNYNLRGLYETPVLSAGADTALNAKAIAADLIEGVRQSGRTLLTESESKQVLAAYGLATVPTLLAFNEAEAVKLAESIGYPVVLKLHSYTVSHKTEVGGVRLNIGDAAGVRSAYQAIESNARQHAGDDCFLGVSVQPMVDTANGYDLILGSSLDPQFGPVLLFGSGGPLVEVYRDRALGLPPLNTTLARRVMEQTRIYTALTGVRRRPPVHLAALEEYMVRFSQLVAEQRWIREIDINPLLAAPDKVMALDARMVLHGLDKSADDLPQLAIRPYPTRYVQPWTMKDGTPTVIRPIRPEDEPLMVKFHETLSERSVYFRYLYMLRLSERIAHDRMIRICFTDYDREMALVSHIHNPETNETSIVGVGRLNALRGVNEAEFAVLINDQYQQRGLGTELVSRLLQVGRDEGYDRIVGDIHPENYSMQRICRKLGFTVRYSIEEQLTKAAITLKGEV